MLRRMWMWACLPLLLLAGCDELNPIKDEFLTISDPTERGLAYVATAIIIAACVRAVMNK